MEDLPPSVWTTTAEAGPETPPLAARAPRRRGGDRRRLHGPVGRAAFAERGADVVVLDAERPGWGASGRNAVRSFPASRTIPTSSSAASAPRRGAACGRSRAGGGLRLGARCAPQDRATRSRALDQRAPSAPAMETLRVRVEQWQRRGAPVELLDRARRRAHGNRMLCGRHARPARRRAHPLGYARGLARAAQRAGAAVHGRSPATGLEAHAGTWRVTTPAGTLAASHRDPRDERLHRQPLAVCSALDGAAVSPET